MYKVIMMLFFYAYSCTLYAQATPPKPKMNYMGAYDSGQAGVSIHKLFDPTEDVVCYLLMPDQAARREGVGGGWIYEGNSVGSMSCVKVRVQVLNAVTSQPKAKNKR